MHTAFSVPYSTASTRSLTCSLREIETRQDSFVLGLTSKLDGHHTELSNLLRLTKRKRDQENSCMNIHALDSFHIMASSTKVIERLSGVAQLKNIVSNLVQFIEIRLGNHRYNMKPPSQT